MKPAVTSERRGNATRLMIVDPSVGVSHTQLGDALNLFSPGDLLIVNRAGTLPSSFRGVIARSGEPLEIRLAAFQGPRTDDLSNWIAISFGAGDWKTPTEKRGAPPEVRTGDRVILAKGLQAQILSVEKERILRLQFIGGDLIAKLYRFGSPIQYSYMSEPLAVWDQQSVFSGAPISVEPASASFPFTWRLVCELLSRGVAFATVLHGAGISSTGSKELDALLPFSEWYEVPEATARKHQEARARGGKIVAIGTSVLRALESAWTGSEVRSGSGISPLRITPEHRIQTADALVTGMHEPGASHRDILGSFCPPPLLQLADDEAEKEGYLSHEYGDLSYFRRSG